MLPWYHQEPTSYEYSSVVDSSITRAQCLPPSLSLWDTSNAGRRTSSVASFEGFFEPCVA